MLDNHNIPRSFFERSPQIVAEDLLGCFLVHKTEKGSIVGKIVETEAYGDQNDLASHARFGVTKRNSIMYGPAGVLYVYHIYGIFYLTNIICEKKEIPSAVLLRSAEIIEGKELAKENLAKSKFVKANNLLATGPGKLSLAFGIDKLNNHLDLSGGNHIFIRPKAGEEEIIETKRIGIDYAREYIEKPWRYYIKDNQFVSKR